MSPCPVCESVESARLDEVRVKVERTVRIEPLIGDPFPAWQPTTFLADLRVCLGCGRVELTMRDPRAWAVAAGAVVENAAAGYR